ncbi:MAG: class II aldolase/adducin family protein [Saccharofermentanales bacterium]|jgi:L-fuculose-phosphate aldolase
MERRQAAEEVLAAGRELVARGLVARTWGNISCRVDDETFVITPSGIDYGRLTPDTIVPVSIKDLSHQGPVKPSSEKGIHAAAYRLNPDTHFVIHTHQTYASCLGLAGSKALKLTAQEEKTMGGPVLLASYGLPGSKSLRKNVASRLLEGRVILMEKHGALITGNSRETAFRRALLLEEVCSRAMAGLHFSQEPPDGVSCIGPEGSLRYRDQAGDRPLDVPADAAQRLHLALRQARPEFPFILHRTSPVIQALLEQTDRLPALLDDFAQLVGSDIRRVSGEDQACLLKASRGRNAILAGSLGVFCYAGEESDAQAILTLVEKNALCYMNAARYGKPKALSLLDRKLMRFVYLKKYAAKK